MRLLSQIIVLTYAPCTEFVASNVGVPPHPSLLLCSISFRKFSSVCPITSGHPTFPSLKALATELSSSRGISTISSLSFIYLFSSHLTKTVLKLQSKGKSFYPNIQTGVYILQNTMARGGGNGAGEKNEN